jgi:hypothetical protein
MIPPTLWIYAGVAAAVFASGMWTHRTVFSAPKIAKLELVAAEQRATWAAESTKASEIARKREGELQVSVEQARKEAQDALQQAEAQRMEVDATNRRIASLRVDAAGLRDKLATYAAARSGEESCTPCLDRAKGLGALLAESAELQSRGRDLLETGSGLAAACGDAADERAVKLKAAIDGWPK